MDIDFPLKGKDENWAKSRQPALTSPDLLNVRPYDASAERARGGQRPALRHKYSTQIGIAATNDVRPVIAIAETTIVSTTLG